MKTKKLTGLNDMRYIGITLGGLSPDNVDYIYNKRLQYFYYQNSSQKEITDNDEGLKYDEQGFIINATFNKVYETGLQIPETTFIENELNRINKIDLTQLENDKKDLVRFYKRYLEAKQQASEPKQPEKGKDKKPKYIWKSKHALSEFYEKVNDNFFEDLSLDDFLDVFTESNKMRLNAINYNQTDIGYLLDNVKPYFIDKVQANYLNCISTKVLFNGKEKNAKAISEILNFHKIKKVEYKESIDEILKSLTPFIK